MKIKRLLSFSLPFLFLFPFAIAADQAIMGTAGDGSLGIVLPTPDQGLPTPTQNNVTGLPVGSDPHGASPAGLDNALVSDFGLFRVYLVRISTNSRLDTISTPAYSGTGTIAVNPAVTRALACGSAGVSTDNTLSVIQAPFTSGSLISTVQLTGTIPSYQTQAIVFNPAGRAFVSHTGGISVLDPPYTAVLFTIPFNSDGGALAITPDGNTLLVTSFSKKIAIFTAPFSSNSTPKLLKTPGNFLDAIKVAPDGQSALVGNADPARVFVVYAPFSDKSTVEEIPLPAVFSGELGFEDVDISSDSQTAIFTGNSDGDGLPGLWVQAPFGRNSATTATTFAVTINGGGRGAGAVRFMPVPDFSLQCVPGSFTSVASVNLSSTCTVRALGGFTGNVNLSCTSVPSGFSCGFGTNPVTATPAGATSALTIGVGAVAPGDYNFNVRGTDGSITKNANIAVKVVNPVFQDNFGDGNADGWVLTGGNWQVVANPRPADENVTTAGNALQGTVDGKGSAISPDFNLGIGTVEADVVVGTPGTKVSLFSWFTGKKDLVEFQILEAKEKFILKQKGGGASGKQVFKRTIDPNTNIHIKITFDGNKFDVFVDGSTTPDITMPAVAQPNGKVGLQIKSDGSATASITNVIAY